MTVAFNIGFVRIGSMQNDSGVFFGQNIQNGWDSHSKHNLSGNGASGDYNIYPSMVSIISDPDFIDVPINDQDIKSPTLAHIMGV